MAKFNVGDAARFSKSAGSRIAAAVGNEIGEILAVSMVDGSEIVTIRFPLYGAEFPIEAAQLVKVK